MRMASATRVRRSAGRDAAHDEPVADVVAHAHVREEGVVLEDGVDVAVEGWDAGDILAVEPDRALGRDLEAGDHAQRRRLPRPRRPQHAEELAVADLEVDAVHRDDVAEALDDAFQAEGGHLAVARHPSDSGPSARPPPAPRTAARRRARGCGHQHRARRSQSANYPVCAVRVSSAIREFRHATAVPRRDRCRGAATFTEIRPAGRGYAGLR